MRMRNVLLTAAAAAAGMYLAAGPGLLHSQTSAPALTGQVSSAEEGNMEGVLVTAKKDGSNMSVTVVSDEKGHYAFPAGRLSPGNYRLSVRAIGYILDGPRTVDVGASGSTADVKLKTTANIAPQMTNSEWYMSMTGTDAQKRRVIDFARLLTSGDDATFARRLPEFLDVDEFARFMAVTVWLSNTDSILIFGTRCANENAVRAKSFC